MRKRQIVKNGGTNYIKLSTADMIDLGLDVGDWVDIEEINLCKQKFKEK